MIVTVYGPICRVIRTASPPFGWCRPNRLPLCSAADRIRYNRILVNKMPRFEPAFVICKGIVTCSDALRSGREYERACHSLISGTLSCYLMICISKEITAASPPRPPKMAQILSTTLRAFFKCLRSHLFLLPRPPSFWERSFFCCLICFLCRVSFFIPIASFAFSGRIIAPLSQLR